MTIETSLSHTTICLSLDAGAIKLSPNEWKEECYETWWNSRLILHEHVTAVILSLSRLRVRQYVGEFIHNGLLDHVMYHLRHCLREWEMKYLVPTIWEIGDCMAHSSTTWEFQPIIFFETSLIQYAADQVPQCGGSSDEGGVSHQGCLHFQSKIWLLPLRPWPEERKAEPEVPLMAVASLRHHQ